MTGAYPTQSPEWYASEFQRRTPLSIHVEVVCGERGRMVGVGREARHVRANEPARETETRRQGSRMSAVRKMTVAGKP